MKNIITLIFILILTSCKAQQTLPLNESADGSPNYTYFKDFNNELDLYVGNWTTNFQGSLILLKIIKEVKRPFVIGNKTFYRDALIVKYQIKNNTGSVLQDTLNNDYIQNTNVKNLIMSVGTNLFGSNETNFVYAGGNCSVGNGEITFKKIDNTHFYWSYYPGTTTRNDITCPPNLDYTIYLPETENLVFTKQ